MRPPDCESNALTAFMTTLSSSTFIEQERICCGYFILGLIFFPALFLGMVMYDNEFGTKENKNEVKEKNEPQHIYHKLMSVLFKSDVLNLLQKNDAKDKMEFVSPNILPVA